MIQLRYKEILYFCIFMLFILSMKLWIGWNGMDIIIYSAILLVLLLLTLSGKIQLQYSKRSMISLICLYLGISYIHKSPFGPQNLLMTALYGYILFIKDIDKILCFYHITKWFAYLMVPSLIVYWLVQLHMLSPIGMMTYAYGEDIFLRNPNYCIRENYIFYMYAPNYYGIRFNGPFVEPGHLGMISAFLLFCNKFDFSKKHNIINFVALIFSFSLAGYVLAFISYIMIRFYMGLLEPRKFIIYFFSFFLVMFFSYQLTKDNVLFQELIINRLEVDDERGFSGNNRTSIEMKEYYDHMWESEDIGLIISGLDKQDWNDLVESEGGFTGTGIIVAMVRRGLLGIMAMMLFYIVFLSFSRDKRFAFMAFVFVFLMFCQRTYPFWFSWIICYAYGITLFEYEKLVRKKLSIQKQRKLI